MVERYVRNNTSLSPSPSAQIHRGVSVRCARALMLATVPESREVHSLYQRNSVGRQNHRRSNLACIMSQGEARVLLIDGESAPPQRASPVWS